MLGKVPVQHKLPHELRKVSFNTFSGLCKRDIGRLPIFTHILPIFYPYSPISYPYSTHILPIFTHILPIFHPYSTHILPIFTHILPIFYPYSPISYPYSTHIHPYPTHIPPIFHPYSTHILPASLPFVLSHSTAMTPRASDEGLIRCLRLSMIY